jgi:membrane fusion protein (multidrug efflux system)
MNALPLPFSLLVLLSFSLVSACDSASHAEKEEGHHEEHHKIVVTSPVAKDAVTTERYVCQIHSRRHIEVRALERGYLETVRVQEGQAVKQGDLLFKIMPVFYEASLNRELADAKLAQIKFKNTKVLADSSIVSDQELALAQAEVSKAKAKVDRARAELNFTSLRAPFDGIVDRQYEQQGSLVEEGDILSTLSDNEVMWVYFNVPEASYLEYKAGIDQEKDGFEIELQLANGEIFPHPGKIGAIEAEFNNETGNIAFRADFPNPDGLLRHGQTGTILIHRTLQDAIVIPQRATYEILANKYVYVVEPVANEKAKDASAKGEKEGEQDAPIPGLARGVVRQREIVIQEEMDDIYLIKKGLGVKDKIIFEGVQQVRDGDVVDYELRPSTEILANLKYHAE